MEVEVVYVRHRLRSGVGGRTRSGHLSCLGASPLSVLSRYWWLLVLVVVARLGPGLLILLQRPDPNMLSASESISQSSKLSIVSWNPLCANSDERLNHISHLARSSHLILLYGTKQHSSGG